MSDIWNNVGQSPNLQAIGIGDFILFFGFKLLGNLKSDSALSPYAVQIFALIVILPVVLTLALTAKFPIEAVTGLLGAIVGFFFGGAHHRTPTPPRMSGRSKKSAGPRGRSRVDTLTSNQSFMRCKFCSVSDRATPLDKTRWLGCSRTKAIPSK